MPMGDAMGAVAHFLDRLPGMLLTWLPLVFFGLIVYLLWRTLQLMPRIKPQTITPHSRSSVTWTAWAWNAIAARQQSSQRLMTSP